MNQPCCPIRLRQGAAPTLQRVARATGCALILLAMASSALAQFPGGFIETPATSLDRPRLTASEIEALLPAARGSFTFPAPYLTQGVRLTVPSDCGGADCVWYVAYPYWRNANNHRGSDIMYIFLSLNRSKGGAGPTLFSYNKKTDEVKNLGPLFPATSTFSWSAANGWYFSGTQPTKIYLNSGASLLRYDVLAKTFETVFDAGPEFGADKYIWQMHSSDDDRVHSATLRQTNTWEMLGCMVYRQDTKKFSYFPKKGEFDECQVDKSGRWLVIKENVDGAYGEDNRIIDLDTGAETLLLDQNGAAGHSDLGHGYMIAADNWNAKPNASRLWKLPLTSLNPVVHHNKNWSTVVTNHISHGNAQPGISPEQQYGCGSNLDSAPRENEIACYRLDSTLDTLIVAPVMTDVNAAGGGDTYSKMPKGNLDVTGQYFIWTSNMGGNRLDAFLVKVPSHLLVETFTATATTLDTMAPTVSLTAPNGGATVSGTLTVSASASDDVAVAGVQFKLDGANLGAELTSSPYSISWNTKTAANGSHSLTAVARDAAGNTSVSPAVSVTVNNVVDTTAPTISSVKASSISATAATINWTTNEPADSQVEYGTSTRYGSMTTLDPALVTVHSVKVTGLRANTLYYFRVKSRDAAGNLRVSSRSFFRTARR